MKNMSWYNRLNKPKLCPPDKVFRPVWIVIYLFMIISFILFIDSGIVKSKTIPITVFSVQLFLNMSWSMVFFKMKRIGLALVINVLLWISVLYLAFSFYQFSKISGLLFIPYLIWNSFAIYLNASFWTLNKKSL